MRLVRKKTADFVVEEIKRMIGSGEIKPGEKLPNQHEFSSRLGVSRTSLREACNTLARIGVIEQKPRVGTIVVSQVQSGYSDYLTPPLISDQQTTRELIEARRYIELDAVELEVKNAADEEIEGLEKLISRMKTAVRGMNIAEYTECDAALHFEIAKASHNRFIIHIFINIIATLDQYIRESFKVFPWMVGLTFKHHEGIVSAIKLRNVTRAKTRMGKHISSAQRTIEEYYAGLSKRQA